MKKLALLLLSTAVCTHIAAQNVVVRGTVTDGQGVVPGVVVSAKGQKAAVATDAMGNYTITVPKNTTLQYSFLGYEPQTRTVRETSTVDVTLKSATQYLDEVVVTGQGAAVSRRRLSSNVTSVNAEQLKGASTARVDQLLQNALPNVQISLSNGQPGTTSMFKSRGLSSAFINSTPIIYVDGVRVDNLNTGSSLLNTLSGQTAASSSLADIPAENIDHIEYVPGGAATTLYGSDAANGVIQIFTKKGGDGHFSGSASAQLGFSVANTQWYHWNRTAKLLHQTGFNERYSLSLSGGTDKLGYSLGASMAYDGGTLIHNANESKRYNLQFGSHAQLSKIVNYQNSFGFVAGDFKRSRNGNQGGYTGLWFAEGDALTNFRYKAEDGTTKNFGYDLDAASDYEFEQMKQFVSLAEELQNNKESVKRFQTSQQLTIEPLKGLTIKGILGIDYRYNTDKNIVTNRYLIHTQQKPEGTTDAGSISNYDRNYFSLTADVNAQWKYYLREQLSNILTAGFQYFNTRDHQSTYSGLDVRDGAQVITGAGTQLADEWLSYLHSYGFYAQDNFGWLNRYYLDLGVRVDDNTAFGSNVGWQVYPKVGLSYVMGEEPWMQQVRAAGWVTLLRLFANYGVAGSYPPAFEYQRTIDVSNYQGHQASTFGKYGNPDLGPEKKYSFEAGLNATVLQGYLDLGFTWYRAVTKDALFSVPTVPSTGQTANYLANVGKIRNMGVELNLGINVVRTQDWTVKLKASVNTNRNKVLSTGGLAPFAIGGFSSRTIQTVVAEGQPVGFLRGAKTIVNEDGSIKEQLQTQYLGTTIPKTYGNFGVKVRWRDLNFSLSGDYQAGSYVHSFDRQFRFAKGVDDDAIPAKALEGTTHGKQWLNFTNFFVEKADFIKVRSIGVDYTLHMHMPVIKSINFSFNCYNPLAWAKSSVDPEAVLSGARSQGAVATGGLNYASFSQPRQFIFGLNVTF